MTVEEKEYLEAVIRAAGGFLEQHPVTALEREITKPEDLCFFEEELHPFVQEVVASAGRLEDILKYARFREPEPSVWRDASGWPEVVFRAAYLMVLEDIKGIIFKAVTGGLPSGALTGGTGGR